MQENNCSIYKEQLFDYVSDLLGDTEREALLSHIQLCPECKNELTEIQAILKATADIPELEVPSSLKISVSEKLAEQSRKATSNRIVFRRFASVAIPFAACIALAVGIFSNGTIDKFMNADNIISSGKTEVSTINEVTEQFDDLPTAVQEEPQTAQAPSTPKKVEPKVSREKTDTPQTTPSPVQTEAPQTDALQAEAPQPEAASDSTMFKRFIPDAEEAASPAAVAEYSADNAPVAPISEVPCSCVVTTDNLSAFADKYGADEASEISFEILADEWDSFESFANGIGASLEVEYTTEGNGYVSIIVKGVSAE